MIYSIPTLGLLLPPASSEKQSAVFVLEAPIGPGISSTQAG
jgi:hypothetical protein